MQVKVIAVDDQDRVKLSRKAALREMAAATAGAGAGAGNCSGGGGGFGGDNRN